MCVGTSLDILQGRYLLLTDCNATFKVERNNAGEVLLVIDGMVLDVTRWLKFHPGGQVVIPQQAKNIDCMRMALFPSISRIIFLTPARPPTTAVAMFEMYHSSRQSFRFLRQFYIGEVRAIDRPQVW